jgi:hypothetical protein
MTKRKEASKKHRGKRLSRLILKKAISLFLTIIVGSLVAILAYSYNERPVVYFSVKTPKIFCLDQGPFCLVIRMWNTGGMSAWVDIVIIVKSFSSLPSTPFLQKYYLTLVRVSTLLIGRTRNYTIIPICIDLQRTPEKHDVTIDIKIRFTLYTIFREQHPLSTTNFRYRKQDSNEYHLGG